MENRRPRIHKMASSKKDLYCQKHPRQRRSPGVCSICLAERLSQLTITCSRSSNTTTMLSSSSSSSSSLSYLSSHDSANALSYSSPLHRSRQIGSEARGFMPQFLRSGKNIVLTKSGTMAFVARIRELEATNHGKKKEEKKKKKKGGFWSKLLQPRSKSHSRTMRERVTTTIH